MVNESPEAMQQAITAIERFPPVMRRMHRDIFTEAKRKTGIAIAHHHIMIMKVLYDFAGLSSSELGAMVFISNAQMTHSTEKLIEMGLIQKQRDIADRRKVSIRLTAKGQTTIQEFDRFMLNLIQENLAGLSDDDLEKLAESFDNIVEVFSSRNRVLQLSH